MDTEHLNQKVAAGHEAASCEIAPASAVDRSQDIATLQNAALKERILRAMHQYQDVADRPPFSFQELIIMALVCSGRLNLDGICEWINNHFLYYRYRVFQTALESFRHRLRGYVYHNPSNTDGKWWIESIHYTLQVFDLPVKRFKLPEVAWRRTELDYAICPFTATTMLDTALGREGPPFPFMRLPSELRYTVYTLLLSYRAQDAPSVRLPLILEDRSLDVLVTNNLARIPFNDPYLLMRCGSMQTKLAILSVSKHIYQEALPYFYNSNRFHFETLWCLRQFLTGIGPERCGYLDQISVRYTVQMDQDASGAFKALTTCERLRSLRILNFDEAYYLDSRSSRLPSLRGRCKSPNDIPGISQLSQLRGIKDLSFSSPPCPQVKAFLRPLITRPHEAPTDKGEEDKPVTKRKKVSTRKSGK